jgi:hypothetical protein
MRIVMFFYFELDYGLEINMFTVKYSWSKKHSNPQFALHLNVHTIAKCGNYNNIALTIYKTRKTKITQVRTIQLTCTLSEKKITE